MNLILIRLILLLIPAVAIAQQETVTPRIAKGTVLVYDVKENGKYYSITVKVNTFNKANGITLQWVTNEIPKRGGETLMSFAVLPRQDQLMLKLVTGKEILTAGSSRFFIGQNMFADLETEHLATVKVDGLEHGFVSLSAAEQTSGIMYNGTTIPVVYLYGEDTDPDNSTINIIALDDEVYLMQEYTSKKMIITLKTITTPAEVKK